MFVILLEKKVSHQTVLLAVHSTTKLVRYLLKCRRMVITSSRCTRSIWGQKDDPPCELRASHRQGLSRSGRQREGWLVRGKKEQGKNTVHSVHVIIMVIVMPSPFSSLLSRMAMVSLLSETPWAFRMSALMPGNLGEDINRPSYENVYNPAPSTSRKYLGGEDKRMQWMRAE